MMRIRILSGGGLGPTNDIYCGAGPSGTVEGVGEVECLVILTSQFSLGGDSTQAPGSVVPDRVSRKSVAVTGAE